MSLKNIRVHHCHTVVMISVKCTLKRPRGTFPTDEMDPNKGAPFDGNVPWPVRRLWIATVVVAGRREKAYIKCYKQRIVLLVLVSSLTMFMGIQKIFRLYFSAQGAGLGDSAHCKAPSSNLHSVREVCLKKHDPVRFCFVKGEV